MTFVKKKLYFNEFIISHIFGFDTLVFSFFKSYTAGCKFNEIAIAQNDVPAKALVLIKGMFGAHLYADFTTIILYRAYLPAVSRERRMI